MNNRTEAKLTDLSGMQKAIEEILKQAWERGRKYGQNEAKTVEPCYQTISCLDCKNYDKENHNCPRYCEVIKEAIKSRPQGGWILHQDSKTWECTNCFNNQIMWSNFCPFCGADMRGEKNEYS